MNVLTVVSPFRNYRMKLLELMSLTAVSMTLALGIMDEPDQSSVETDAVSSLSALIVAVNVVFAVCAISEVVAEVNKKNRKKLRTQQLWKRARLQKELLLAILKQGPPLGSPHGGDTTSSCENSTKFLVLPTTQAQECTADTLEIEMSDVSPHDDILQQRPEAPGAVDGRISEHESLPLGPADASASGSSSGTMPPAPPAPAISARWRAASAAVQSAVRLQDAIKPDLWDRRGTRGGAVQLIGQLDELIEGAGRAGETGAD